MGFISRSIEKAKEQRGLSLHDMGRLMDISAGYYGPTNAGVTVTEESALRSSAVYAAVRILSWSIAALPLHVYRESGRGKEKEKDHPNYKILHREPNKEMTSFTFRSTAMAHILLYGNFFAEAEFRAGDLAALWPIPPWRVRLYRTQKKRELFYKVAMPEGGSRDVPAYKMFHVMGLSTDGLRGLSVIASVARESVGLALAIEEFGSRFFGQGTHSGGVVEHPGKISNEVHERLSNSLKDKYSGLGKTHRIILMEEGMKFHKIGIPPNEAQFIESKRYQVEDIARIYNVPLHLLQEMTKNTSWGSGLEQLNIGFVVHSLTPYLINWEQEAQRKLFVDDDSHFSKFSVEGLLRGDSKARSEFYSKLFQMAAISPNEIRAYEDKNPYEGGDEYYIQLNMVPVSGLLTEQEVDNLNRSSTLEERKKKLTEIRSKRSAQTRFRIAKSYERVVAEASRRVSIREREVVLSQAKKIFINNSPSELLLFGEFLNEFYEKQAPYMKRQMFPVFMAIAEAIQSESAKEVDAEEGMSEEMEKFVESYQEKYVQRHSIESNNVLYSKARDAINDGELAAEVVEEQLGHWEENRPKEEASHETVKLRDAVAKFVFMGAGIQNLQWVAMGGKPCNFCEDLDGKVVGIQGNFFNKGDNFKVGQESLPINTNIGHAPLHGG